MDYKTRPTADSASTDEGRSNGSRKSRRISSEGTDSGCRRILLTTPLVLGEIKIPDGSSDLDESEDLKDLLKRESKAEEGIPEGFQLDDLWKLCPKCVSSCNRTLKRTVLEKLAKEGVSIKVEVRLFETAEEPPAEERDIEKVEEVQGKAQETVNKKSQTRLKRGDKKDNRKAKVFKEKLSPAAILILAMGMRKKTKLFAELAGCSPHRVIHELMPFLRHHRYFLMNLDGLPTFLQCAARNLTAPKDERPKDSVLLAVEAVDAVAAALGHSGAFKHEQIKNLVRNAVHYGYEKQKVTGDRDHKDTGCRVGLLMAGIQKYVLKAADDWKKKAQLGSLLVDVSSSLLAAAPFGFVIAAGGAIVKEGVNWLKEKKIKDVNKLCYAIKVYFDMTFGSQIFFDSELILVNEGKEEKIEIKEELFNPWYKKMLEWNATNIHSSLS